MKKKFLIAIIVLAAIFSLSFSFCFAEENKNSNSVNLGNEITNSMNKTGQNAKNMVNGAMNIGQDMKNEMGDMGKKIVNGASQVVEGVKDGMNNMNNNPTSGYYAERTSIDSENTDVGMTSTTWMWILFAVAAAIIMLAIWYFATQNDKTDMR